MTWGPIFDFIAHLRQPPRTECRFYATSICYARHYQLLYGFAAYRNTSALFAILILRRRRILLAPSDALITEKGVSTKMVFPGVYFFDSEHII